MDSDKQITLENVTKKDTQKAGVENPCIHHWLLTPENDQDFTRGVCKKCGAIKFFPSGVKRSPVFYQTWLSGTGKR